MSVSFALYGIPVSQGIVIGRAHVISSAIRDVQHYLVAREAVAHEIARFHLAIDQVNQELSQLEAELTQDILQDIKIFIEMHQMILQDEILHSTAIHLIKKRCYNAEWALSEALKKLTEHFDGIEDDYLRERKVDIEQVVERILKALVDQSLQTAQMHGLEGDEKMIVVAHDISPADMLQLRNRALGGFVTDMGGRTSHTAIVARGLGFPATAGMANASLLIHEKDLLVVDGQQGVVIVNPSGCVLEQYLAKQSEEQRFLAQLQQLKNHPTQTRCGEPIHLYMNIELPEDAQTAFSLGAQGIGLFRSEFILLDEMGHLLEEEQQFSAYKKAVQAMHGLPVTIRTADVGADKFLNTLYEEADAPKNPALGLKGIRWSLSEPKIFLEQLRAILRASVFGKVNLLLPMLVSQAEIEQAFELIAEAKQQLDAAGLAYDPNAQIGAMIEVPAAALALPLFIQYFDFLSIGTNDLIQYTLAVDRTDSDVGYLYDPLHPAVLFLLDKVISQATQAGVPVSVCGEMAGNSSFTRLLLGMGLKYFSSSSGQLLSIKKEVLNTSLDQVRPLVQQILSTYDQKSIVEQVNALANCA